MRGLFIPLGTFGRIPGTHTNLLNKFVIVPGAITHRRTGAVGNGAIDQKKDLSHVKKDKSFLYKEILLIFLDSATDYPFVWTL